MANVRGRGVRVEIAATYGTAKTVTAVTQASPGVATSSAHGMANDTVGYFSSVGGMVQLEDQACRVKNQTANTFDLQGLNTTGYTAFTSGTFTPVATWAERLEWLFWYRPLRPLQAQAGRPCSTSTPSRAAGTCRAGTATG